MLDSEYFLLLPILTIVSSISIFFVFSRPRFLPVIGKRETSTISIIIPARNEATNISNLLESINQQTHPPTEVIVVNDSSTDDTASISESHGATVIHSTSLPEGWKGKPWACQQGSEHATSEWILFLDADTSLHPHFLDHLQNVTNTDNMAFSVCPYHIVKKPYEQLSAFFNVLMAAGVNAFGTGSSSGQNSALFGQSLFITRKHYRQIHGHQPVKNQVLENFHLARYLDEQNIMRQCYLGKGNLTMRMFPNGLGELWSSWKKGFVTGAASAHPRTLTLSSIWISGAMLAIVCVALATTLPASSTFITLTAIAYCIYVIQCLFLFKTVGSFSVLNALLFPVSLLFYQILFFSSLIDRIRGKQTQWKGRLVD